MSELKMWILTSLIVVTVFAINLTFQVTTAKAQDLVKNFINQKGEILETTYADARDSFMICRHNPKLPSCPISKVFPKPTPSAR